MPTYQDDFLVSDSGAAPGASPLVMPPQQPGIGLAPAGDAQQQAIAKMGGVEKGLSALGEFGSALTGRGSPLNARIAVEQREKAGKLHELRAFSDVTTRAFEEADKLTGDARNQYITMQSNKLNEISPGSGDILKTLIEDPEYGKLVMKNAEKSPTLRTALEVGGLRKARDLVKSVEGAKLIRSEIESAEFPEIRKRLQSLGLAAQQLMTPERYKQMMEDGYISPVEAAEINLVAREHPELKTIALSDEQMRLASGNEDATYGMAGFVTSRTAQEVIKSKATKGPESTVGKINADLKAGHISPEEAKAAIDKANRDSSGVTINMPGSSGMGVNPDTGKAGHYSIGKDGKTRWDPVQPLPPNVNPVQAAVADIITRTGQGGGLAPPKSAAKPGAVPPGLPAGSKKIGKSPDGKDVWQSPDGKKWVP